MKIKKQLLPLALAINLLLTSSPATVFADEISAEEQTTEQAPSAPTDPAPEEKASTPAPTKEKKTAQEKEEGEASNTDTTVWNGGNAQCPEFSMCDGINNPTSDWNNILALIGTLFGSSDKDSGATSGGTSTDTTTISTPKVSYSVSSFSNTLREEGQVGGDAKLDTHGIGIVRANQELYQENQISVDLIGKIVAISGDIITVQDRDGKQIDVHAPNSGLKDGDYINVQGAVLSGSDGNIYIASDPASGLGVSINKISQDVFNQKAQQQQQAAQEFAQTYPEAAGYSGTGAAGAYYSPSSERRAAQQPTIADEAQPTESAEAPATSEEPGFFDNALDYAGNVAGKVESFVNNWTWGKTASVGAVAVGGVMMIAATAASVGSGGTALPLSAPLFQAGVTLAGAGVGTLIIQEKDQENQERLEPYKQEYNEQDARVKAYMDETRQKMENMSQNQ